MSAVKEVPDVIPTRTVSTCMEVTSVSVMQGIHHGEECAWVSHIDFSRMYHGTFYCVTDHIIYV